MARTQQPFGWDVDTEVKVPVSPMIAHTETRTYHYRGCTEARARRKAMLNTGAIRVLATRPVERDEWIRAYGIGRM